MKTTCMAAELLGILLSTRALQRFVRRHFLTATTC